MVQSRRISPSGGVLIFLSGTAAMFVTGLFTRKGESESLLQRVPHGISKSGEKAKTSAVNEQTRNAAPLSGRNSFSSFPGL